MGCIRQLRPPIEMDTPRGRGWAWLVIDYGVDHDLIWVCFLSESGACWSFRNPDVRMRPNETYNIRLPSPKPEHPIREDAEAWIEQMQQRSEHLAAAVRDVLSVPARTTRAGKMTARFRASLGRLEEALAWGGDDP